MHFMLKVVLEDAIGGDLVAAVAEEEVATEEESMVYVVVVAIGEGNPILPPYHTLTRSGRFLDTIIRARYLLSAIKLNRARLMRSRYQKRQFLRSPRLRTDRNMVRQSQGRNRVLVTV